MTCGDIPGVLTNTAELLELSEQYGLPQPGAIGLVYRGWGLMASGKPEGLALAQEGISALEGFGLRIFLSRAYCAMAESCLCAGRQAEGLQQVKKALLIASDIGESFYLPRILLINAKLLRATGRHNEDAEASLRQSIELARIQGAKSFELCAALELFPLWSKKGKHAEARELLSPICNALSQEPDMPGVKDARKLLDMH